MFNALRRAWKNYWASIPAPADDELVPDGKIIREDFRPDPVDPGVRAAFAALAAAITAHLPAELGAKAQRQLVAKLKPGTEPIDALSQWISKVSAPNSSVHGFVAVDWKAREEIQWQADRLLKAHQLPPTWAYDVNGDQAWQSWGERGEVPVDTPLKLLGVFLATHDHTLVRLHNDDVVCAFAIPAQALPEVQRLCQTAQIALAVDL
jgi:hypothetical protein